MSRLRTIGANAFGGCTNLTSITIPNSVTNIGNSAFYDCSGLTSIAIGNSVTSIGNSAFYGCTNIQTATMPTLAISFVPKNNLQTVVLTSGTNIGNSAFYDCSSLTSITIPDSVTSIGSEAFYNCIGLASIEIPYRVTLIDNSVFYGCSGLTSITIPNNVTSIGEYAFSGCSSLTSITIPNIVTLIGDDAFSGCNSLTSIAIRNSMSSIGNRAFKNCSALTTIEINSTSIGQQAFYGCTSIGTIALGDGVHNIENQAFSYCTSMLSVAIPSAILNIKPEAFAYCTNLVNAEVGDGTAPCVVKMGRGIFSGCTKLQSLSIPFVGGDTSDVTTLYLGYLFNPDDSTPSPNKQINVPSALARVTIWDNFRIHPEALSQCSHIKRITIGAGVISIGAGSFRNCTSLQRVDLENATFTSIGEEAFQNCTALRQFASNNGGAANYVVDIPSTVSSIGYLAFDDCSLITSFKFSNPDTSIGTTILKNCAHVSKISVASTDFFNSSTTPMVRYLFGDQTTHTDDMTVYTINGQSCAVPNRFHEAEILNGSVGAWSLRELPGLNKVSFGAGVNDITLGACSGCYNLSEIEWSDISAQNIWNEAFYGCSALRNVTIPTSITYIGSNAFRDTGLAQASFADSSGRWKIGNTSTYVLGSTNAQTLAQYLSKHSDSGGYANYFWQWFASNS